jgi:hypothetical protein
MADLDRIERFSKIRTKLGFPKPQKPSPHTILTQMLIDEQALNLRLTNTQQPWSLISKTLATVAGTSEYTIDQPVSSYQNSGKVHYVIRSTGDADLPYLSVPFDDFSELNYGKMPTTGEVNANFIVPEKLSFYRANAQNQTQIAVIQPTPQEVLTYTIWYFVGSLDRSRALMSSVGPVSELSDWLDLKSMMALLPDSEWTDDVDMNERERKNRAVGFLFQLDGSNGNNGLNTIVDKYLSNINAPKSFDLDFWDED